jgi:hypothetical protein
MFVFAFLGSSCGLEILATRQNLVWLNRELMEGSKVSRPNVTS